MVLFRRPGGERQGNRQGFPDITLLDEGSIGEPLISPPAKPIASLLNRPGTGILFALP